MYNSRNFYEAQASMIIAKIMEQKTALNYATDVLVKIDITKRIKLLEKELDFYVKQIRNM